MGIHFTTATDLCAQIRAGKLTSVEVLRQYIQQIEKYDGAINAIAVGDFERALADAKAADRKRTAVQADKLGPLHGLPLTIKESFDVCGLATTWSLKSHEHHFPNENAEVVRRLHAAGAIIFGKTNVPDALADHQTSSSIFGITTNPWNFDLTCGGSSGGSAAALAAGFTSLELGSDLAGSLRIPAHFCGVYTHKPSYGVIPQTGHSLLEGSAPTDLTVIGPMARSVKDLRLMFEVLTGPNQLDAIGWKTTLPKERARQLNEFRVAVLANHPACHVDGAIEASILGLASELRNNGARVDELAEWPVDLEICSHDYMMMTRAIAQRRSPREQLEGLSVQAATLSDCDRSYKAATRRAAGMTQRDWHEINDRRHAFRIRWQRFFESYDVVLCPVHASQAFPHNLNVERENRTLCVNGRQQDYNASLFWMSIAGLNYLPATVCPIASANGLPIGVQVIGPYLEDYTTLRFAELLEGLCPRPTYPLES